MLSCRASEERLAELVEHWQAFYESEGDAAGAWTALLTLLMRDPAFLLH
ncbi:MAG: hypothetical protein GY913_12330 [Proteobacteria bacterium]|nr:hypothetical protein [Pseudomonadota bacterium]MCP4917703.1 hypothetical protein [Pseudomonadota bacterium]